MVLFFEIEGTEEKWNEYNEMWNVNSSLEPEWTVYEPHFKNLKPRHELDPENGWGAMEKQQKKIIEDNDHKVVVKYGYGGSCTLYGAETGEVIFPFSRIKDMQDFKKKNNLTIVKNSRRNNMIKSSETSELFDKAILKAAELVKKVDEEEIYDNAGNIKLNEELDHITVGLLDLPFDFDLEPQELWSYIKKVIPADYFTDYRCWYNLYDVVHDNIYKSVGFNVNSSRRTKMKKSIKSAHGSWRYQTDDMDEAEAKIGDIGISFTEPLLVADDGTIYTRAGFNEWLKFLEKEYPNNWTDAYETYHQDSDEEFIAMCKEYYFRHDFGSTLFLYSEGLKSIAESIAEEVPSNEAPFSISSGFAFELYPEEEEPSGFNSYWIDDMELPESFIWGINPSIGNRFDVIIDPEYLWNGVENITSNRRTNMKKIIKSVSVNKQLTGNFTDFNDALDYAKTLLEEQYSDCEVSLGSDEGGDFFIISNDKINHKFYVDEDGATMVDDNGNVVANSSMLEDWEDLAGSVMDLMDIYAIDYDDVYDGDASYLNNSRKPIKSGRYIKSGTSSFGSNNDIFGYSFPLVTYIAENYMYDEETDSETEERDYDADDWEYEDALSNAKALADEMDIPQYDDYSEPYLCYEPFMIKFRDGYYEGLWIEVKEGTDETPYDENGEYQGNLNWKPFTEEQMNQYADKLNEYFNRLCSEYGWVKLGVSARFSNGETWYSKIDSAKKSKKSKKSKHPDEVAKDEGADITCSRKSIKSGMSYEQALREFTSNGKPWGDYWSMQYDWTMFVDSLERDDLVDYEEARWWDNPCTPETFREWKEE